MSNLLDRKVMIKGNVLSVCEDELWVDIYLGEPEMNALTWMVLSNTEVTFSRKLTEWEIFFGPYINGAETGYIFQVINLYSRNVTTAAVPFDGDADVKKIKRALYSMLCGGNDDEEKEEQEGVHEEL